MYHNTDIYSISTNKSNQFTVNFHDVSKEIKFEFDNSNIKNANIIFYSYKQRISKNKNKHELICGNSRNSYKYKNKSVKIPFINHINNLKIRIKFAEIKNNMLNGKVILDYKFKDGLRVNNIKVTFKNNKMHGKLIVMEKTLSSYLYYDKDKLNGICSQCVYSSDSKLYNRDLYYIKNNYIDSYLTNGLLNEQSMPNIYEPYYNFYVDGEIILNHINMKKKQLMKKVITYYKKLRDIIN